VAPLADARADLGTGFEDDRLDPAGEQVRRGGQSDRTGANDRDAIRVRVIHGSALLDEGHRRISMRCAQTVHNFRRDIKKFRYA
jgi:hypothetical protein